MTTPLNSAPLPPGTRPADLGARFASILIDGVVCVPALMLMSLPINAVARSAEATGEDPGVGITLLALLPFVVMVGYFVWGWAGGRTIGMRVMKLQVVDTTTNRPIGAARALGRYLMLCLMGLPCYLGYLSIITETQSGFYRGWHDKATNAKVIRG